MRAAARLYRHNKHDGNFNGHSTIASVGLEYIYHWLFGENAMYPLRETDARLPLFARIPRKKSGWGQFRESVPSKEDLSYER